jgi:hypothetical protein
VAAAGTARDKACADVAPPRPNGARRTSAREKPARSEEQDAIPPGKEPLPDHPSEFAEEIHRRIDLIEVWVSLLRSKDEKIKQRAAERLTDLHYKLGAAMEDELQPIVIDIDSAVARRAAEGAKE